MIWACTETSSAVVGSSAMMNSGSAQTASAITHALAHAAGELVRIAVDPLFRRGNADLGLRGRWRGGGPPPRTKFKWVRIVSTIWSPTQ